LCAFFCMSAVFALTVTSSTGLASFDDFRTLRSAWVDFFVFFALAFESAAWPLCFDSSSATPSHLPLPVTLPFVSLATDASPMQCATGDSCAQDWSGISARSFLFDTSELTPSAFPALLEIPSVSSATNAASMQVAKGSSRSNRSSGISAFMVGAAPKQRDIKGSGALRALLSVSASSIPMELVLYADNGVSRTCSLGNESSDTTSGTGEFRWVGISSSSLPNLGEEMADDGATPGEGHGRTFGEEAGDDDAAIPGDGHDRTFGEEVGDDDGAIAGDGLTRTFVEEGDEDGTVAGDGHGRASNDG